MGHVAVPRGLQVTAAWAWRLVAVAAAAYVVLWLVARTQLVIVPVAIALLLSAALQPMAAALARRGVPSALAAAVVLLGGVAVIGLLIWLVVHQFRAGLGELTSEVNGGVDKIRDWLVTGPLGLSEQQIDSAITSIRQSLSNNRSALTSGAIGAAATVGHVLAGLLLALFATFFFVKDGRRIWSWLVRLFPAGARQRVRGAGERAWRTLIAALVAKGPVTALVLLGIVLLVQQVEGHLLQPLVLGRAVAVHPLAVVFGIATGTLLAGIIGALVAVPIVAVVNTVASYLSAGRVQAVPTAPPDSDSPVPTSG